MDVYAIAEVAVAEGQIPVRLGLPRSGKADTFTHRPPLISVQVASDDNWTSAAKTWPLHNETIYAALLDTGADHCAIDEAVANEIGAKPFGNGYSSGWGGTSNQVKMTAVQVLIPGAGIIFLAQVAILDFRGAGQQWDVLLGRDFLKHCHLVVDGPASRYELNWASSAPSSM